MSGEGLIFDSAGADMGSQGPLQKRTILILLCLLVVGASLAIVIRSFRASDPDAGGDRSGLAFYTDDDGATFFTDSITKVPPFDRNGKQAVRCFVFSLNGGKQKFVGYLQRYTEESKKRREEMIAGRVPDGSVPTRPLEFELKKPGDSTWIRNTDPRASAVMNPKAPNGSTEVPVPVDPD